MSKRRAAKSKTSKTALTPVSLVPSTNIPLTRLRISNDNVRHIKNGVSIEQLADSIARRSLLQSLSVRPVIDGDGHETGDYEIPGGGRRFSALKLLVKQKRLAADADVPCIVKTTGTVVDDSLAENTDREDLHPLDEFRAFEAMAAKGTPEDDIAAAYRVTPAIVRQRLKLAAASPVLLKAYANDELTLEQLMAFCITDDHKRQNTVWKAIQKNQMHASAGSIRRALTETAINALDRRVRFIGLEAYINAGGPVVRDLFAKQDEEGAYLQDPELLTRLVSDKLDSVKQEFIERGWKWAEAAVEIAYSDKQGLTRLAPSKCSLSREDQVTLKQLTAKYDALIEQFDEDNSQEETDELNRKSDALQEEIDRLSTPVPVYKKKDMARAGVFIDLNSDGSLAVDYGFIRSEDRIAADLAGEDDGDNLGNADDDGEATPKKDIGGLSESLVQDLTSYRTLALRDRLAHDFGTAFRAVLYTFCLSQFDFCEDTGCLQISSNRNFPARAPGLDERPSAKRIDERHRAWATRIPRDADQLWTMLGKLSLDEAQALFAHCASLTLNAVREPHRDRRDELRHANHLAAALDLDMFEEGFRPTEDNYFGRITKAQILAAVSEAVDETAVHRIKDFKKPALVKEAARLVEGSGWLPLPWRKQAASPLSADDRDPAAVLPEAAE